MAWRAPLPDLGLRAVSLVFASIVAVQAQLVTDSRRGRRTAGTGVEEEHLQPNPPTWPPSVHIFSPGQEGEIRNIVDEAYARNGGHGELGSGQHSKSRYAFLFKPGVYHVDIPVGYYTQVLGLGLGPTDVVFDSAEGVYCKAGISQDPFAPAGSPWRGAENFCRNGNMLWAASRGAPLRRLVVRGALRLAESGGLGAGVAAPGGGGFLANVYVSSGVTSAGRPPWCARNSELNGWQGEAGWGGVFVGSRGAPLGSCSRTGSAGPVVNAPSSPVIAEKPFITVDPGGHYSLQVPKVRRGHTGTDFEPGRAVDFSEVFLARESDSAATINTHLQRGLHVVLSPGVYRLRQPLVLTHPGQVLLGLGLATLVPILGTPAVCITAAGVRVAGLLLEAPLGSAATLLEWSGLGVASQPGILHDVYARVRPGHGPPGLGPPGLAHASLGGALATLRLEQGHVVADNLWLWHAGAGAYAHGLHVSAPNVTAYGVAVEHVLGDLVLWSGEAGEVYSFQGELPRGATKDYAGHVGYRVANSVSMHRAHGLSVYHAFRDPAVTLASGIAAPAWLEASFEAPFTACVGGEGRVLHVVNGLGGSTDKIEQTSWLCESGPRMKPTTTTTRPAGTALASANWLLVGPSISIWAWALLASQFLAVCALSAMLWRLNGRVRQICDGRATSPERTGPTPSPARGTAQLLAMAAAAATPLSPLTPANVRTLSLTSPVRNDEA